MSTTSGTTSSFHTHLPLAPSVFDYIYVSKCYPTKQIVLESYIDDDRMLSHWLLRKI